MAVELITQEVLHTPALALQPYLRILNQPIHTALTVRPVEQFLLQLQDQHPVLHA